MMCKSSFLSIKYHFLYWINRLQDPFIVSQFQKYFGVIIKDDFKRTDLNLDLSKEINLCHSDPLNPKNQSNQNGLKVISSLNNTSINTSSNQTNGIGILRHRRDLSSASLSDYSEAQSDSDSDLRKRPTVDYHIENSFWYYLFSFGASLGYELFYSSLFPFWFWNIDSAVCRRVINVWVFIMYVGQATKDIIRWPRPPSPPVVQLEPGYSIEYGMPSTHAMVGVAVPFSFLVFTMHRYEYPVIIGIFIATVWCILVCLSRLYLGMHTVLDIIGGLLLVTLLMSIAIPLADTIDHFQLTNPYSPLVTILVLISMVYFYPSSDRWTPARGDTTVILGTGGGISIGSWLNYQMGIISGPGLPPPYQIIWPDYRVLGLALLRASIGILCVVATRAFFKSLTYGFVCFVLRLNPNDLKTKQRVAVEVPYKLLTYMAIGIVVTYLSPVVFRLLKIERITMFTEV